MVDCGLDPGKKDSELTVDEKQTIEDLKELLGSERKAFIGRKMTLTSNFPKLYGLMWGKCIPAL